MDALLEKLISALPIIIIVLVVLILFLSFWRRVPADKAMVITGIRKRVLLGKGGLMIPLLETSCTISLENISMTTDVSEAPAKQGIFVNIVGTAVVKVKNDSENVLKAVEQFCSGGEKNTVNVIRTIVEQILEGKLRGIVSTLTVEQINEDRASFEQRIEDDIRNELGSMGLVLISYTILKISTQGGYLENRAKPQIAAAKSEADIAEAERRRDTEIRTALANREGQKAKLEAEAEIAQSERDKKIKLESFRAEQDKAKANADVAYKLKEVENNALLAEQQAELAEKEAVVVEKKLIAEVKKPADAKKYEVEVSAEASKIRAIKQAEAEAETIRVKAKAEADAKKLQAEADAAAIRAKGLAEAEAIKARGIAEAEAKDKLAEAMAKYGEAAIVEMVVNKLPDVMKEVASPLEQIDKLTVIDNGGNQGASKVSKIVTDVASNGFEVLKDLTGVDLSKVINDFVSKSSNSKPISSENNVLDSESIPKDIDDAKIEKDLD